MKNTLTIPWLVSILCGCIQAEESSLEKNATHVNCDPPARTEAIVSQNADYILVGEVHGTVETPAVFAEFVCAIAETGKRTLVALEFSENVAPAFQTYVESSGGTADISDFLADSGWLLSARQFADGRTSLAMWRMVERLRTLRAAGQDISVTTFVRPVPDATQTAREISRAASLHEAALRGNFDLTIALVGNLHARKQPYDPEVEGLNSFEPMAMHLPQDSTISLLAVSAGGEAWICQEECGVTQIAGWPSSVDTGAGIVLDQERHAGYDGMIAIGTITASPPLTDVPP